MEEKWINDVYETCLKHLGGLDYKKEVTVEEQGLQNLCEAVVYLFGKAHIDTDRVYH